MKKGITPITIDDMVYFSDINAESIHEAFFNFTYPGSGIAKEIATKLVGQLREEMKTAILSLAGIRQYEPTRFEWLFMQEVLKASEKIKRQEAKRLEDYDVEMDIANTRREIESSLASQYKTEVVLWSLMDKGQYKDALTILAAIEIERASKDAISRFEVLNWKLDIYSKSCDEEGFFNTLEIMLKFQFEDGVEGVKYSEEGFKNVFAYLLANKFPKGIQMSFLPSGIAKIAYDNTYLLTVGMDFQDLLLSKITTAVLKERKVTTPEGLNSYLKNEWINIVNSFRLINRYILNVERPIIKL